MQDNQKYIDAIKHLYNKYPDIFNKALEQLKIRDNKVKNIDKTT